MKTLKDIPIWVWIVIGILALVTIYLYTNNSQYSNYIEDYQLCIRWCLIEHHVCQFANLSDIPHIVNCSSNLNICEKDCGLSPKSKTAELFQNYLDRN